MKSSPRKERLPNGRDRWLAGSGPNEQDSFRRLLHQSRISPRTPDRGDGRVDLSAFCFLLQELWKLYSSQHILTER
ncbi:uncharacterized protein BO72DRAFT_450382 [Aspergillus fijiensis CBS 313.89]|uniref:Uncharacterized protein n=1 Tax=Aspergillus fijiensis CBS 313.89 TaxID=1448319 RepID=A0A8G1RMZ0_9EURO|nr:uncharacterized protein BO72DRAFT_450382 [Aspergillus fijiensis CBS 313.89]RAK74725.1 hypothetical protein BO72DRAFT_450382 [Aspergillus fijiensis CBS 313.89]